MRKKIFSFFTSFIFLFLLSLVFPRLVLAARFNLEPSSGNYQVGSEFQVSIFLDTQDKRTNGVQAKLFFNQALLEVKAASFAGIFPSNFQSIDNGGGFVLLGSGEDLSTDFFEGNSVWVTLTLKAKDQGLARLTFSCPDSAILEYKTTKNLLDCGNLGTGDYSIEQPPAATPTPTPTQVPGQPPAATPTPTPTTGGAPGCPDSSPGTPTNLKATSGPGVGEVMLTWTKVAGADYYGIVFGTSSRTYQYGATNIGNTGQYVVRQLIPGGLYYFVVFATRGCASSGFSPEVSARALSAVGSPAPGGRVTATPTPARRVATPTPVVYQPVEEIFPEVEFPSEEEVVTPTPTMVPEEQQAGINRGKILRVVLILGLLATLVGGIGFFLKRRLSSGTTVILPPEMSPPEEEKKP